MSELAIDCLNCANDGTMACRICDSDFKFYVEKESEKEGAEKLREELKVLVEPLQNYMFERLRNPHLKIVIDIDSFELTEGLLGYNREKGMNKISGKVDNV